MKANDWVLLATGLTFGAVLGALSTAAMLPNKLLLGPDGRLQWETLVTGAGAVAAAVLTVLAMRRQMAQSDRHVEDLRWRRERAARATLPVALAEICEYASACIKGFAVIRGCFSDDGSLDEAKGATVANAWQYPGFPQSALLVLKECIEHSEVDAAEALASLMRHIQVQRSRMVDAVGRLRVPGGEHVIVSLNIDQAILDAAEIYARCGALFPFARGATGAGFLPEPVNIRQALMIAGVDETACAYVYSRAERWAPRNHLEPAI